MNLGNEDEYKEFKESLSQLDKGLKSITAMLNKHGRALLYFGVKDNGDVCGLEIGKDTLMNIRNKIRDKIEPRVYVDIKDKITDDGKNYIEIYASGSDIPYSYDGRYYIRNISADEQASNEILRKMLSSSDADIIRQKTSPTQELTFKTFFAILSGCGVHPKNSKEFFESYALLNNDKRFNMNAYLLADNNSCSIKVVVFDGIDKSVMSKRTEYKDKCLLLTLSEVLEYFEAINITKVDVKGATRKEIQLFDYSCFREAWINACLHNDWNTGIAPAIYMYDDRIEIISYGGLPFSLSKEGFYKGTSIPVNKSLLTIFIATKYAEQSGHGVPTIVEKYGKGAFSFDDGILKVTIPLEFERDEVTKRKEMVTKEFNLTENQNNVLNLIIKDSSISQKDIADTLGLSLSGVKKITDKLQDCNLIIRKGSKRDGYWIAKK